MDLDNYATFNDFFEQAAVGLHLVGPDGTILHANRTELELLGYHRDEYVGHHIAEFHADPVSIADILARLARGETLHDYEARMRAKDGSLKHVLITSNVRRATNGDFLHTRCFTRDITDLKQIDADRRATEARFEILTRVAPVGLFRTDAKGDCLYVNQRWSEITGLSPEQARGAGWAATLHPEDRERVFDEWYRAAKEGSEFVTEYRFRRPNGDVRWVVGRGLPEVCDGVVTGYIGSVADVTDRKRAELEREQLLHQERAARAAAEASNRTKDQILAIVSHELRTPLNSILGYARMLRSGDLDETARPHALDVIIRSASAQSRLVEDLLDLSRIVSGRMAFTFEQCSVTALVDEALDAVRPAADTKGIAVGTAFESDLGDILCAPDRLRQVVWNLAMNAIKFTPAGGRIDVGVTRADGDVHIVVADNGVGISAGVLPHIFEPFRQEDSSTTRAHAGLGIGLALVKHIVELHGGRVYAESAGKGRGATFTVTMPLGSRRPGSTARRPVSSE